MEPIIREKRTDEVAVTEGCPERPYLEVRVPDTLQKVDNVVISLTSHDQGYCSEPEWIGRPGYTWFEAHIGKPTARNNVLRLNIHSNIAAEWEWQNTRVSLNDPSFSEGDYGGSHEQTKDFLDAIEPGDILQIIPKALFPGWVNYVSSVEIELYGKSAPPQATDEAQFSRIRYNELDTDRKCIRLLRLRPGTRNDVIAVDLIPNKYLDDKSIPYEALSYSWGLLSTGHYIKVFQEDSTKPLDVSVSAGLHAAFLHLRYHDRERILWADQLCVNQRARAETEYQVSIMGEVYAQSEECIVWLGEGKEHVRRSLNLIKTMFSRGDDPVPEEICNDVGEMLFYDWDEKPLNANAAVVHLINSLSRVFALPWFWRVWVLQEAWLPPRITFQYGNDLFQWDWFLNANRWLNSRGGYLPNTQQVNLPYPWTALEVLQNLATDKGDTPSLVKMPLLSLVLQVLDMKATDPRDKIFGVLGLANESPPLDLSSRDQLVRPSYEKSVSEVFIDFTWWWIERNQSLKILSAVHGIHGRTWQSLNCTGSSNVPRHDMPPEEHPSWALWHSGQFKWANESLGFKSPAYQASGGRRTFLVPVEESHSARRRLKLRGVRLGAISSIKTFLTYKRQVETELDQSFRRIFDLSSRRHTWNSPLSMINESAADEVEHGPWVCDPYCLDDSFCTIGDDTDGLCPAVAQVGDIVVVLHGSPVPHILREVPNSSNFAFIGECFVEGKMDGSAYSLVDAGVLKEEEFTLV